MFPEETPVPEDPEELPVLVLFDVLVLLIGVLFVIENRYGKDMEE